MTDLLTHRYGGYGSNLDLERFRAYIEGSDDTGHGAHRGSADAGAVLATGLATVRGELYFAGKSRRWNAAVAFLDTSSNPGSVAYLRTYELSCAQL